MLQLLQVKHYTECLKSKNKNTNFALGCAKYAKKGVERTANSSHELFNWNNNCRSLTVTKYFIESWSSRFNYTI